MEPRAHRRRAVIVLVVSAVAFAIGGFLYAQYSSVLTLERVLHIEPAPSELAVSEPAPEPKQEVSTPPPLRAKTPPPPPESVGVPSDTSALTRAGILARTNAERAANGGLPPLTGNAVLDAVAIGRLEDMFAKHYFAHVAPDGGKAETVAKISGYEFITLGENLALGYYKGDAGVVTAWMESPGHRANILNTRYTELGVAARKGTFEGEETWIAVQIFARPASDCPGPDKNLKTTIENERAALLDIEASLEAKQAELEGMQPKRGAAYNQKVDEYNALVGQYNAFAGQLKVKIAEYNASVAAFNLCIGA